MTGTVLTVILNWRTAEMTLRAAKAAQRAMEGIAGAIVIVDNDSQDGSFEKITAATRDWPRTHVLQSGHNGGYGAGNNVGIRAGLPDGLRPDYVYLLNSDAFPDAQAITTLRDHLDATPKDGFAGSYIHGEDGAGHVTAFRFPSAWSEFEGAAQTGPISRALSRYVVPMGLPKGTTPIDWCAGASIMFRRDALDQCGIFDEAFFLYFEETDLCHRIISAGWSGAYVPASRVMHIGSVSTGMKGWTRPPAYWFESRSLYFLKRGGRAYLLLVTFAHLAGASLWALRCLLTRKDNQIPPHFLRDLVAHTLKAMTPRATATRAEKGTDRSAC